MDKMDKMDKMNRMNKIDKTEKLEKDKFEIYSETDQINNLDNAGNNIENKIEKRIPKESARDLCEDIRHDNLPHKLEELEMQIDRLKQRWGEFTYLIGQRLQYIRDNKLFLQKNYPDFKTYVKIALKMSENNAYYYIAIFEYFTEEQTRKAGSKLKLIIPVLNKIKYDKKIPLDIKDTRLNDLKNELYLKIYNKTYRDAEKIIDDLKKKYFTSAPVIKAFKRIEIKKDRIIIYEDDQSLQDEIVKLIEDFYS